MVSLNNGTYQAYCDCGNHTTIVDVYSPRGGMERIVIPTLVSKGNERMGYESYVVEDYNGQSYVVGDENKTVNLNIYLSKNDLSHKLTVFTAIHQCVPNGANVELFVGLPIHSFYTKENKKEYIEFYKQDQTLTLKINNVEKTFNIVKVMAVPESVGHVFNYPTESLVGVVDIGYTTIDAAVFKNSAPIRDSIFTLVDGANPFKIKVRDTLNQQLRLNIQHYQMDEILSKGLYGSKTEEAKGIIHKCKEEYLTSIVTEMVKHSWEITTLPIVFTGGGALLLKDVIEEYETFRVSENPVFDNVEGFGEMGRILNE